MRSTSELKERSRYLLVCLGLIAAATAIYLPTEWYEHIPKSRENLPIPPIKGVTLVRLCFGLEGLLLLILGLRGKVHLDMQEDDCLRLPPPMTGPWRELRAPAAWVASATILGAAVRFYGLNSDLWLDEITTIFDYLDFSTFHILVAYTSSNNHLFNTLLVHRMIDVFGMQEWAIRLPAALLGIACIPAVYYLARTALGRSESMAACLLLAVSYHHIFFSQNARGYTGLLLWGMLGTAFFLRGLTSSRLRYWILYVLVMFLAMGTILYSFFVVSAHGAAFVAALWMLRHQGRSLGPLIKRASAAWAVLGILCFHLYASVLPQVYVLMQVLYRDPPGGFAPLSLEYAEEVVRGLSVGVGGVIGLTLAAFVGGSGFFIFFRRHPLFSLTLILPLLATASFVLLLNLIVLPRSFLWALPTACIFAAAAGAGLGRLGERFGTPAARAPIALLGLLVVLSLASLPAYYRTPKQPNRASLRWVMEQKGPDDPVVAIFLAEWGVRFYGPQFGLRENETFWAVRSEQGLKDVEDSHPGKTVWLLTTLPRALHMMYPGLEREIADHYRLERSFPATIGGGEIGVWRRVR
jgi:hypothetical protein